MITYKILGKNIYQDETTGELFSSNFYITSVNKNVLKKLFLNNYSPTCYRFCVLFGSKCNLNCSYCFSTHDDDDFNINYILSKLDFLFSLFPEGEKYFIDMSGECEPLLYLDKILIIANYCKNKSNSLRKEIIPCFVTNGTLLSDNIVKILRENNILFGISFDGILRVNDKKRINLFGESFGKDIIRRISKLEDRSLIGVSVTLTDDVFNIVESIKFLNKYFDSICFRTCRQNFCTTPEITLKWIKEYEKLGAWILGELKNGSIKSLKPLINSDDYFSKFIGSFILNTKYLNRCDASISRFTILKNDFLCGCPPQKYNPNSHFFANDAKLNQFKEIKNCVELCNDCLFKIYCGGFCKVEKTTCEIAVLNNICLFRKNLILIAFAVSEEIKSKREIYKEVFMLYDQRKTDTLFSDPKLIRYCNDNKHISFFDARIQFYERKHKI